MFKEVTATEHQQHAVSIRRVLAKYVEVEDLLQIGAYQKGAIPESDRAIEMFPLVNQFLRQAMNAPSPLAST